MLYVLLFSGAHPLSLSFFRVILALLTFLLFLGLINWRVGKGANNNRNNNNNRLRTYCQPVKHTYVLTQYFSQQSYKIDTIFNFPVE